MWRFPKPWGYPEIIQVMDDHLSIETHGDLGILHFKNRPSYSVKSWQLQEELRDSRQNV